MKPATPLPWQMANIGQCFTVRGDGNGHCIVDTNAASKSKHAVRHDIHALAEHEQNVAFIVHACNNYGRLVDCVRQVASESRGPRGAAAAALLRELGEL